MDRPLKPVPLDYVPPETVPAGAVSEFIGDVVISLLALLLFGVLVTALLYLIIGPQLRAH